MNLEVQMKDSDLLQLIIRENGMWFKTASQGSNSLMRATSNCLYFTDVYHEEIQRRVIEFFLENLGKIKFNFLFCKDVNWVRLFVQHPALPEFEQANLELISCFFRIRLKLYYINNGVLCSDIYYTKTKPIIRVLKLIDNNYAALFSEKFHEHAIFAQNIALSIIDCALDRRLWAYRESNNEAFIAFEYETWRHESSPGPDKCRMKPKPPLAVKNNDFNNFFKYSIGNGSINDGDLSLKRNIGSEIVQSLKSRRNNQPIRSNAQTLDRKTQLLEKALERLKQQEAAEKNVLEANLENLYSLIINEDFESQYDKIQMIGSFIHFLSESKNDDSGDSNNQNKDFSPDFEETVLNQKDNDGSHNMSPTRSLPNHRASNIDDDLDEDDEQRSNYHRIYANYDSKYGVSKSRDGSAKIEKQSRRSNSKFFQFSDPKSSIKSPLENFGDSSDKNVQNIIGSLSRPQMQHSQSVPNLDQQKEQSPTQQNNPSFFTGNSSQADDPQTDQTVGTNTEDIDSSLFKKPKETESLPPKKTLLRQKMQEKMKGKKIEEFNASRHSLPDLDSPVKPQQPFTNFSELPPYGLSYGHLHAQPAYLNTEDKHTHLKHNYASRLDSQYHTGILKFFDEKNGFGFITIEENGVLEDIFVYRSEFDKAKISIDIVRLIKSGIVLSFSFQITRYSGKYKESKKATSLRLLNDLA